jgi:hypothetical protein
MSLGWIKATSNYDRWTQDMRDLMRRADDVYQQCAGAIQHFRAEGNPDACRTFALLDTALAQEVDLFTSLDTLCLAIELDSIAPVRRSSAALRDRPNTQDLDEWWAVAALTALETRILPLKEMIAGKLVSLDLLSPSSAIYPTLKMHIERLYAAVVMLDARQQPLDDLLVCGNLSPLAKTQQMRRRLSIETMHDLLSGMNPNKEAQRVTRRVIQAALDGDAQQLEDSLISLLKGTASTYYDMNAESHYHNFLVARLETYCDGHYRVVSNAADINSRLDIMYCPRLTGMPGFVWELKMAENDSVAALTAAAQTGVDQCKRKQYEYMLEKEGAGPRRLYGIGFNRGKVKVLQVPPASK